MMWRNGFELYFIFSFLWSSSFRRTVCLIQKYQMFFSLHRCVASCSLFVLKHPFIFCCSQLFNFTIPLGFCIGHTVNLKMYFLQKALSPLLVKKVPRSVVIFAGNQRPSSVDCCKNLNTLPVFGSGRSISSSHPDLLFSVVI